MTTEQMMGSLASYYGEAYTGILGASVRDYLDGFDARTRATLFELLVRRYSRRWGKAPDVATIGEYLEEAEQAARPATKEIEAPQLSDAERKELARLIDGARKTPEGRLLLGIIGGQE